MTASSAERRIRAGLPFLRLLQVVIPLALVRRLEKRATTVSVPADFTHQVVTADGVRCEWFIPRSSPTDQALLYLHGGGFVYGLTGMHRQMVVYLARQMNCRVLMVDYRLAPEHPYPAALNDCYTAYHWLLKQGYAATNLAIAGDSAGGNLTLTTLMKLRDNGDPLPTAGVCLSPVADLTDHANRLATVYDAVLHPRASRYYIQSYVGGNDARDPLISPVFGDWHGLPPLLIHAAEDEVLRADAVQVEQQARTAGVDVRLEVYPRMWHVWQINLSLPQAAQSLEDIARFLRAHLGAGIAAEPRA